MNAPSDLQARLRRHVEALEGPRHPDTAPEALRDAEAYLVDRLAELNLSVERRPFTFGGQRYHNVVAVREGTDPTRPRILVGAHFDSAGATPGADDNASGVAALIEIARRVTVRPAGAATVELVGFNLEEPQRGLIYRVGSRAFARDARRVGVRYAGALVLEMVGYTDRRPGSQAKPLLLFWKRVPTAGIFLAAVGDGQSTRLLRAFAAAAKASVPSLPIVTFRSPLRGRLVPHTRLSDNASFWDQGYPALMVTDTAFLRNPNYHRESDVSATLDYAFLASVTKAVGHAVQRIDGS